MKLALSAGLDLFSERSGLSLKHLSWEDVQGLGILEILDDPALEDIDLPVVIETRLSDPASLRLPHDHVVVDEGNFLIR